MTNFATSKKLNYIDLNGTVEGKRLIDHFGDLPFGWSADTLRYVVSAILVGGSIVLPISGREVKTIGQQAINALKINCSFSKVEVSLGAQPPSIEKLVRACKHLTELIGEIVILLEQKIAKAAKSCHGEVSEV